jgi:hypothetical protein
MMPNNNVETLTELVMKYKVPLKIHFLLHSPCDVERFELIPSTKVTIREALTRLIDYQNRVFKDPYIQERYKKCHESAKWL